MEVVLFILMFSAVPLVLGMWIGVKLQQYYINKNR